MHPINRQYIDFFKSQCYSLRKIKGVEYNRGI